MEDNCNETAHKESLVVAKEFEETPTNGNTLQHQLQADGDCYYPSEEFISADNCFDNEFADFGNFQQFIQEKRDVVVENLSDVASDSECNVVFNNHAYPLSADLEFGDHLELSNEEVAGPSIEKPTKSIFSNVFQSINQFREGRASTNTRISTSDQSSTIAPLAIYSDNRSDRKESANAKSSSITSFFGFHHRDLSIRTFQANHPNQPSYLLSPPEGKLYSAVADDDVEKVTYLLFHIIRGNKSTIDWQNPEDNFHTCLINAAYRNFPGMVELIVQSGANLDLKDAFGNTALTWAAIHSNVSVMRVLLVAGADVDARNDKGETALLKAVQNRHHPGSDDDALKLLVSSRARINLQDFRGRTPLMLAADRGDTDAALLLLQSGADMELEDESRRRAESYAIKNRNSDILTLFKRWKQKESFNEANASAFLGPGRFGSGSSSVGQLQWEAEVPFMSRVWSGDREDDGETHAVCWGSSGYRTGCYFRSGWSV